MIEVLDVVTGGTVDGLVSGLAIDEPWPAAKVDGYVLKIKGWVAGRSDVPKAIHLAHEGRVIKKASLGASSGSPVMPAGRADAPGPRFWMGIGVVGLPPQFELALRVAFEGGQEQEIAVIRGSHTPLQTGFEPRRSPIMVTTLARTGSTWLMHVLSMHPRILVHRRFPYEMVPNRYWMHLLKVVSDPAEPCSWGFLDPFHGDRHRVGNNPYFSEAAESVPELDAWFSTQHIERIAAICQELTEGYYDRVAAHQRDEGATYFAEKHLHGPIQWILWDIYSGAREVFLVRDPRDMLASMEAFNRKRGYPAFGRERVSSDEEWLHRIKRDYDRLLDTREARADHSYLLRYEEFVLDPGRALDRILNYLGCESGRGIIDQMLARAREDSVSLASHMTAGDPRASVGRWQQLPLRRRRRLQEIFAEVVERLGYA